MAAMKWKGSLVRWFGSVYKMKRDKVYIYIYIEGGEEGKSWGVEANDINYSQSPGLKYPKNSGICSWTEAALVGPDTKCLCLNKGFYPSLPPRLWQIRREILFSLPPFSPSFALIALFEIFTSLICAHDGRADPCDYFFRSLSRTSREILNEHAGRMLLLFLSLFTCWTDIISMPWTRSIG